MNAEQFIHYIELLLLILSLTSIGIIVTEERNLRFWRFSKRPWSVVWRLSFWTVILMQSLDLIGISHLIEGIRPFNVGNIMWIVAFLLMCVSMNLMAWIFIWGNRLDWWNAGKRWQRIVLGASISLSIIFVIISGLLSE